MMIYDRRNIKIIYYASEKKAALVLALAASCITVLYASSLFVLMNITIFIHSYVMIEAQRERNRWEVHSEEHYE